MKSIALFLAAFAISISASAAGSHSVKGHVTKKGVYVAPSRATSPDKTRSNNYSNKGNVNPYSGKKGTKN